MGLGEYQRKRRFDRTPEPAGAASKRRVRGRLLYVIQKHASSRLHYDFRLEDDGVLKSWAVPKGPSLDPKERRLAVQVEDHPLEYGEFEGTIPAGEYGGGTVLLWDRGWWQPQGDVADGLRRGRLKFELHGEKLHGGWNLVRLRASEDGKPNWLLIKERDDAALPLEQGDIVAERPESVESGLDLVAIAGARGAKVWRSNRGGAPAQAKKRARRTPSPSRRIAFPPFVPPQLATLVQTAPGGEGWLHEIKFDGYRILASLAGGRARLLTRTGKDWSQRFPEIAEALGALEAESALLDGEVVALDENGRSSFQALQNALRDDRRAATLVYFVFDLLALDGVDRRSRPLIQRKADLSTLLAPSGAADRSLLRYSDHVAGDGDEFFRHACRLGVEGVVAKRAAAPYHSGRNRDWLKVKCTSRQEFIVIGYTEPSGSRSGLGALLLAVHEGKALRYCGKVGTGFDAATLKELRRRLEPLGRPDPHPALANPPRGAPARRVHWVEPRIVAEVTFTEWTDEGLLRHPSFEGLREDKPASDVRREGPATAPSQSGREPGVAGVRLSHPDRVLYPEQGVTKLDLARYYEAVADWLLPHVSGRPLTLVRCPQGRGSACFYQKHIKEGTPPAVRSVVIREEGGASQPYLFVEDLAGVVSLVQIGVLELHGWGALAADVERPDRLVFDLDPDTAVPWKNVVAAALLLRQRLADLGLRSFVQTTGGKGLHVVAPLSRRNDWQEVKTFARSLAEDLVRAAPSHFVSKASKAARRGKIFIDWLRNARGASAILPYSTRARPGATVATPLRWDEAARRTPGDFDVATVPRRLRALRDDPWADFWAIDQKISRAKRSKL